MRPHLALRDRLAARPLLSTFVALHDPAVVSLLAAAGLESVVIDQEHGVMPPHRVRPLVLAAHAAGRYAFVRPPEIRRAAFQDALEAGADGVLVPMVQHEAEAHRVVEWTRYPPVGSRGFHPLTGGSDYGARPGGPLARNAELLVAVQIETARGLANLEAIAAVPGLDALFLGPGDLSLSLGVPMDGPEIAAALRQLIAACRRHGLVAGTFVGTAGQARTALEAGARWLIAGGDAHLLQDGARHALGPLLALCP